MRIDNRKPLAQGDVIFVPIEAVPADALDRPARPEGEIRGGAAFIVAHSETGHHHVIAEKPDLKMFSGMDQFRAFLQVEGDDPVTVEHLREHHTHEPIALAPGAWEIRRQRTPGVEKGSWQMAVD